MVTSGPTDARWDGREVVGQNASTWHTLGPQRHWYENIWTEQSRVSLSSCIHIPRAHTRTPTHSTNLRRQFRPKPNFNISPCLGMRVSGLFDALLHLRPRECRCARRRFVEVGALLRQFYQGFAVNLFQLCSGFQERFEGFG